VRTRTGPAALALVLLGLAGAGCTGPRRDVRHAFRQIGHALETRDRALFHAYVDVESVAATAMDVLVQRPLRGSEELEGVGAFASGLVNATRQMLGLLLAARIDEAFRDPERTFRPVRGRLLAVRREGVRTIAEVELLGRGDEALRLDVALEPHEGHLRVVEVDLAAVLDALEDRGAR
jgi:hypothetical protein